MTLILAYTIKRSLFLTLFLVLGSFAKVPGQAIITDSIPKSKMFVPTLVRIGTDFIGVSRSVLSKDRDAWEIQAEVDIYRYFITAEFGNEAFAFYKPNYGYQSDGNYWRIGADINMIPREAFGSVLYFGLRYARSTFNERLIGVISNPEWGPVQIDASNEKIKANWIEIVTGMKAKVWQNLYLGYALRLKASLKIDDLNDLDVEPFRVPGYGLANENSFWGINYYVAWQFPLRQKYTIPKKP